MKTCTKCYQTKELEEFYKHKQGFGGRTAQCKVCLRERANNYRKENKEYYREYGKKWRSENPEKLIEYQKKHAPWKGGGKHILPKVWLGRGEWIHLEDACQIMEAFGSKCVYCDRHKDDLPYKKLGFDHLIPFSKGGKGIKENLVPCCGDCNSCKGPREWLLKYKQKEIDEIHPFR